MGNPNAINLPVGSIWGWLMAAVCSHQSSQTCWWLRDGLWHWPHDWNCYTPKSLSKTIIQDLDDTRLPIRSPWLPDSFQAVPQEVELVYEEDPEEEPADDDPEDRVLTTAVLKQVKDVKAPSLAPNRAASSIDYCCQFCMSHWPYFTQNVSVLLGGYAWVLLFWNGNIKKNWWKSH